MTREDELYSMNGATLVKLADKLGVKVACNKTRTQLKEKKENVVNRILEAEKKISDTKVDKKIENKVEKTITAKEVKKEIKSETKKEKKAKTKTKTVKTNTEEKVDSADIEAIKVYVTDYAKNRGAEIYYPKTGRMNWLAIKVNGKNVMGLEYSRKKVNIVYKSVNVDIVPDRLVKRNFDAVTVVSNLDTSKKVIDKILKSLL